VKPLFTFLISLLLLGFTYSQQCKGTTKTGARCKNQTNNASGYCYIHESQASGSYGSSSQSKGAYVRCSATTKAGTQCKHMTSNANGRCYQHQ
jgi:hypothetical protein